MGFEDSIKKATAEAMANGTLETLKKEHPKLSWRGRIDYDFNTKKFTFTGFTKEENEIISKVTFK